MTHSISYYLNRFKELQKIGAGRTLAPRGLAEVAAKLPLEDPVGPAELLLLAQLVAVIRHAHARQHPVLAGLGFELALGVERAARALQEKVGAFPARQLAFGSGVSSHFATPVLVRCGGASADGSRCAVSASRPRCW